MFLKTTLSKWKSRPKYARLSLEELYHKDGPQFKWPIWYSSGMGDSVSYSHAAAFDICRAIQLIDKGKRK